MSRIGWAALAASLLLAGGAVAQTPGATVTVTLDGVHGGGGKVLASLCDDPSKGFPGDCLTYAAMAPAQAGRTVVVFTGVKPGTYALQAFHDLNGDMRPEIPPEGYAFGNGAAWPPAFDKASIKVGSDTSASLRMTYVGDGQ